MSLLRSMHYYPSWNNLLIGRHHESIHRASLVADINKPLISMNTDQAETMLTSTCSPLMELSPSLSTASLAELADDRASKGSL